MSLFAVIKQNAKKALNNHWGTAIGSFLVPFFVSLVLSITMGIVSFTLISGLPPIDFTEIYVFSDLIYYLNNFSILILSGFIYSLISFLIFVPLNLGIVRWNFNLVKGKPLPLMSIFYFFEKGGRYWKSLGLSINLSVRKYLWKIAFFIFPTFVFYGAYYFIYINYDIIVENNAYLILCWLGIFILFLCSIVVNLLYVAHINRYFLAQYLISLGDNNSIGKSIKRSTQYMKKHKYKLLWLNLSFLGWFVLGSIFFPVMFYVLPYYNASMAVYAQYLFETIKREQPVLIDRIPDFKQEIRNPEIKAPVNAIPEPDNNPVWGEDYFSLDDLDI